VCNSYITFCITNEITKKDNNIKEFEVLKLKKNSLKVLGGIIIGLINSLLGAGGGMVAVPLLKKTSMNQTEAQASAIAVIFPLTIASIIGYYLTDKINIRDSFEYLIPGVIGAACGASLLPKIPVKILKKLFAAFMIWAGIRMILK